MTSNRVPENLESNHLHHRKAPPRRPHTPSLLATGVSLAAFSFAGACSTQEVEHGYFKLSATAGAEQSAPFGLSLVEDADTYEESQRLATSGKAPSYTVKVDGKWAVEQVSDTESWLVQIESGTVAGMHWMSAGSHVFELVDAKGNTVLKTPAYDVESGQSNHLMVFGHKDALEHRFFADSFDIPAGMQKFTVINLLRSGESVEVLKCDVSGGVPASCTTVSGPAAYGELARGETEKPASVGSPTFPSGLFYRILPTASLPAPALQTCVYDFLIGSQRPPEAPAIYVGGPVFVGQDGNFLEGVL